MKLIITLDNVQTTGPTALRMAARQSRLPVTTPPYGVSVVVRLSQATAPIAEPPK